MTIPMVIVAVLVLGGLLLAVCAAVRDAQERRTEQEDADRAARSLAGEFRPVFGFGPHAKPPVVSRVSDPQR